jgi:hypothetical protein
MVRNCKENTSVEIPFDKKKFTTKTKEKHLKNNSF